MNPRRLHCIRRPTDRVPAKACLLFVHGGYATAECWAPYFFPWFSRQGYDCHAFDLSGHGGSEGRERLHAFGIDDYVQDLAHAAGDFERPVVVIGHSMGSVIVERYLERHAARAAVLMSPVPATGIVGATLKVAFHTPAFFDQQARATRGEIGAETLRTIREVYYSPETTSDDLLRFGPLFQDESRRALVDLSLLPLRAAGRRPRLPVLVVGGERDAVFPPNLLAYTAARWHGEVAIAPRAGHTLMLDAHWQAAAESITRWLERLP